MRHSQGGSSAQAPGAQGGRRRPPPPRTRLHSNPGVQAPIWRRRSRQAKAAGAEEPEEEFCRGSACRGKWHPITWFEFNTSLKKRCATCNFCRAKAAKKTAEKRAAAEAAGGE